MTIEYILLAIMAVTQLLDFYTTRRVIELGGYERNAVVKWFMDTLGMRVGLFVTKMFVVAMIAAYIVTRQYYPEVLIYPSYWITVPCIAFYVYILSGNFKALEEQKAFKASIP